MLGTVAAALCVGYDVTRLGTALSIKSVLLRCGAQSLADGYGNALGGTGFDPGGCNALKARVTK